MPRPRREKALGKHLTLAAVVLFLGCSKKSTEAQGGSPSVRPASTAPAAKASALPDSKFGCQQLLSEELGVAQPARTIRLRPPDPAEKAIVLSKTGVVVTFNRDEFLTTARCLGLKRAVTYIEQETGHTQESPLRDAFQLSYVAAALLDTGRVGVRLEDERESRATIVRDTWSAEGCAGQCRAVGREYRLTESDPLFFFRVTDKREDKAK